LRGFPITLAATKGTVVAGDDSMEPKPAHVVVAYDFSPLSRTVLDRAIAMVVRAPFHVLHFVTVIDPHNGIPIVPAEGHIDYRYADRVRDQMAAAIAESFRAAAVSPEVHFFLHARIGKASDEILALANEVGADMIFIGTHGHTGLDRLLLGSVAERVVREAGCPVIVVRAKTDRDVELQTIVEVPPHKTPASRRYLFSYTNNNVVMRPPDWPGTLC
jgi:nucleotide-binding universal stress UspA family protein